MPLARNRFIGDAGRRENQEPWRGCRHAEEHLLSPELLGTLRAMGHGDELAIVDANYPAESGGRLLIRVDGLQATTVAEAVLSVMPLDGFVPCAAFHMQVVDEPGASLPIFDEFRALLRKHEPKSREA